MGSGFRFTSGKNRSSYSLSRALRVNEKRSDLRRFRPGVKLACVPAGKLVAAEKCFSLAPTSAAEQPPVAIGNEICPVNNQAGVNAEDAPDGCFNLLV